MSTYVKNNKDFDRESADASDQPKVLRANLVGIEHGRESFPYGYLPDDLKRLLREAFGCYAADLLLAFAIVCRRAIQVSEAASPAAGTLSFERLYDDAAQLSGIEPATRAALHEILFGPGQETDIDADLAAVLIEIVKDMFQQRYVRSAKLRRAIRMRRFFAREADPDRTQSRDGA